MEKKKILISALMFFLVSCGNPELEKHKANLDLAIADKDHYSIIKNANRVLMIDSEDVEAIAAFRDSARVYTHIRDAAENLKRLDESKIDDVDLMLTMETPDDDPKFQQMLRTYYREVISSEEITSNFIAEINEYVSGYSEGDAPNEVADSTKRAFVELEIARKYEVILEDYQEQVNYLVDAKKHLSKAERLDPRFKGVIDLEEIVNERAEVFAVVTHSYIAKKIMGVAIEGVGYFEKVYSATNGYWDSWASVGMTSLGIDRAYQFGKLDVDTKDMIKPIVFKQYRDNAQILLGIYKDIEDEFEDIDSIEPAIELIEATIEILRLTEAEGSLREWNDSMRSASSDFLRAQREMINEIDPIEKVDEEKAELEAALDIILDEEILSALDKADFI